MSTNNIGLKEAVARLNATSPDQPYEIRQSIGYGLVWEYGRDGENAYADWRSEKIKPAEARAEAKGFRLADGSIGIGSFIKFTKAPHQTFTPPTLAEIEARERRKAKEKAKAEEAHKRLKHYIQSLYDRSNSGLYEVGTSKYLGQKMGSLELDAADLINGLRTGTDRDGSYIIYPLHNGSYQIIRDDGSKKTYRGAAEAKGYTTIGNPIRSKVIYCAEGLVTGLTVALATGCAVVVCLDAGGLQRWSPIIVEQYPNKPVIVAADNDQWDKKTGLLGGSKTGEKAAIATDLRYALPDFTGLNRAGMPTDFNDLYHLAGLEVVKDQINKLIGADTHQIGCRYLTDVKLNSGLTIIKSPKGTGKTKWLKQQLKEQLADKKTLIISHRVTLNEQIARDCGAVCYKHYINEHNHMLRGSRRLVISPDSLHRIDGSLWDAVIIDESEQVLQHFTSSIMADRAKQNIDLLGHLMKNATYQVFMDADAGQMTIDYACRLGLSGTMICNDYKPCEGRTMYVYETKEQAEAVLCERAKTGSLFVATGRNHATRLHGIFCDSYSTEIITSYQTQGEGEREATEFIEHVTERSEDIDILFTSSAVGTGVSIDSKQGKPAYDAVFGFFSNDHKINNTTEQAHQHISRVRDCQEYHVWLDDRRFKRTANPKHIRQDIIDGYQETCAYIGREAERRLFDEDLLWLECMTRAKVAESKNGWRQRFIDQAISEGYEIVMVAHDQEATEAQKEANKEAKAKERKALMDKVDKAEIVPLSDIQKAVDKGLNFDPVIVAKSRAAELYQVSPKELTGFTMALLDGYESTIGRVIPIITKESEVKLLDSLAVSKAEKKGTVVGLKHQAIFRRDAIKAIALYGISPDLVYDGKTVRHKGNMKVVQSFLARQVKRPTLGVDVSSQAAVYPGTALKALNRIMDSFGIEIASNNIRKANKQVRVYSPNQPNLDKVKSYAERLKNS